MAKYIRQSNGNIYEFDEENNLWFCINSMVTYKTAEEIPDVLKRGDTPEEIMFSVGEVERPDLVREEIESEPMKGDWLPTIKEYQKGKPHVRRTEIYAYSPNGGYKKIFERNPDEDEWRRCYISRI